MNSLTEHRTHVGTNMMRFCIIRSMIFFFLCVWLSSISFVLKIRSCTSLFMPFYLVWCLQTGDAYVVISIGMHDYSVWSCFNTQGSATRRLTRTTSLSGQWSQPPPPRLSFSLPVTQSCTMRSIWRMTLVLYCNWRRKIIQPMNTIWPENRWIQLLTSRHRKNQHNPLQSRRRVRWDPRRRNQRGRKMRTESRNRKRWRSSKSWNRRATRSYLWIRSDMNRSERGNAAISARTWSTARHWSTTAWLAHSFIALTATKIMNPLAKRWRSKMLHDVIRNDYTMRVTLRKRFEFRGKT